MRGESQEYSHQLHGGGGTQRSLAPPWARATNNPGARVPALLLHQPLQSVSQTHPQPGPQTSPGTQILSLSTPLRCVQCGSAEWGLDGNGLNIWASVSPWRRRMDKAVSPAAPWGDLESSRGQRFLAAARLWEAGPARPWIPAAKMRSGLVCPTSGPRSRPAVSVPLRSSTPHHGQAPDVIGRALGAGGCRSPGAAHRSFQHPELRRQQSVRHGLLRRHRASEAGGPGRGRGWAPRADLRRA